MSALLELEPITDCHAFNTARWEELLADPVLAALDHRIETDRYGHILMSPPPELKMEAGNSMPAVFLTTC